MRRTPKWKAGSIPTKTLHPHPHPSPFYLVEDQGLRDGSPGGGQGADVQQDDENQHQDQSDGGVDGADQEAHDHAANQAQRARVPGEVAERGPENTTQARD